MGASGEGGRATRPGTGSGAPGPVAGARRCHSQSPLRLARGAVLGCKHRHSPRGPGGGSGPERGTIHPLFPRPPGACGPRGNEGSASQQPSPARQASPPGPGGRQGRAQERTWRSRLQGGADGPPESQLSVLWGLGAQAQPQALAHGPACAHHLGDWGRGSLSRLGTVPGQTLLQAEEGPVVGTAHPLPLSPVVPRQYLHLSYWGWGAGQRGAGVCLEGG